MPLTDAASERASPRRWPRSDARNTFLKNLGSKSAATRRCRTGTRSPHRHCTTRRPPLDVHSTPTTRVHLTSTTRTTRHQPLDDITDPHHFERRLGDGLRIASESGA
ncbi:hypothetical protein M885DRAFT_519495 [Pelagophyceae sp. CCMP2097]|nr:hypothetical protein M885DRAFT_519495 [Pelagophyceae sp. CCMP2097]